MPWVARRRFDGTGRQGAKAASRLVSKHLRFARVVSDPWWVGHRRRRGFSAGGNRGDNPANKLPSARIL